MQLTPYLSFNGQCEEAFRFYERALGGRLGDLFRYGGSPMDVPAGWEDKIMHGTLKLGDQVLMGADAPPGQYEEPRGTSLSLHIANAADAERIFQGLVEGGKAVMPIQETFWAERFGMLVDRFGTPWMINCEKAEASQGT